MITRTLDSLRVSKIQTHYGDDYALKDLNILSEPSDESCPKPTPGAGTVFGCYVLIWLLEGAIRKWGPPALGTPLYFARDAFMALFFFAFIVLVPAYRRVPLWILVPEAVTLAVAALQLLAGRTTASVAIVGVRQFIGPLLAIHFVIRYVGREQLERISIVVVFMVPIQCSIAILQVLSPAQSWINAVGNDQFTGFFTANGVVRASGTFTAAYGLVCYLMIATPLVLTEPWGVDHPPRLLIRLQPVLLPLLLLTTAISGSRSAILFVGIALCAQLIMAISAQDQRARKSVMRSVLAIGIGFTLALWLAPGVMTAFHQRSQSAEQTQSSTDRLRQQALLFTTQLQSADILGDGLGSHSAGGIAAGSSKGWIEDELGRWIAEAGVVGIIEVLFRELFSIIIIVRAWRWYKDSRERLPVLMACILAPSMLGGLINTQPSQQGYAVLAIVYWLSCLGSE